MEIQYFKEFSPALGRDMECKVYGHAGHPVLYIPCQDGRFVDFENFNMTDYWAPYLESGQVMIFSIDTIDAETYSSGADPRQRICRHEDWIRYITDEMVPFMFDMTAERNGGCRPRGVIAFGCSLGATHAANLYFRRPDLFDGLLALSGIYSTQYGFGDYMDDLVYANSPVDYLSNFPADHPYMDLYRERKAVICCGQGAWEQPDTTRRIKEILESKGIPVWVDIWGWDVNHDWPWWYKQVEYFVPWLLEQE
ncbi:MAG: esterase [Clostridiales bacterium]|nr:esterase [Clostridiales bacterium]